MIPEKFRPLLERFVIATRDPIDKRLLLPRSGPKLSDLLRYYIDLPYGERAPILQEFRNLGAGLGHNGGGYAELAIRQQSAEMIRFGVLCVILSAPVGAGSWGLRHVADPRVLAADLCLLYHSAEKLGLDAPAFFREVVEQYGDESARNHIEEYLKQGRVDIAKFGYYEAKSDEGFAYWVKG